MTLFLKATKLRVVDIYMHFLIRKADLKYTWFMKEGRKFHCVACPSA